VSDEAERWRLRFERERAARREAETLLHEKSREIYLANEALKARADELTMSMATLASAQEALVRQGKMAALGGLVAGLAHEINTPLGVAVTAVSLTVEQADELDAMVASGRLSKSGLQRLVSSLRESTSLARANMERAAALVQSFKRVAVDQSSEAPRTAQLDKLLSDIVSSLSPVLRKAGATVDLHAPVGFTVQIDAGALGQIVTNLLQNACIHAFAPPATDGATSGTPPAVITIEASVRENAVVLVVADNGSGMTADVAARVWEPFFTTRRGDGGSGLGMHIVHNLVVERFKGTIALDTAPGAGCRYTIHLPFGFGTLQTGEAV
jgi:C4-dicarboxylate-specific signal transduction histidine kinase